MQPTADSTPPLCPSCGAALPPPAGFSQWCEACEWNLLPPEEVANPSALGRIYRQLGARLGETLFEDVMRGADLRPHVTGAGVATLAMAGVIYAVTVLLALSGVWLLWSGWPNPFAVLLAVVLLGSAWVTRPRFAPVPDEVLDRHTYPALYALVDRVADALGAPRAAGVTVSANFNACVRQSGLRGARYVELGLPLMTVLAPQERVAVLAHEFSHLVNGDPLRGTFVANALRVLFYWIYVIQPDEVWDSSGTKSAGPIVAILMIPVNLALLGIALALTGLAYLMVALVYRDSQRAEYLADLLATRASGQAAMRASLEKTLLGDSVEWVAHRHANFRQPGEDLFAKLRDYLSTMPPREHERRRRLAARQRSAVDDTHPPTLARIKFIEAHGEVEPSIVLTTNEVRLIDEELRRYQEVVTRVLEQRHDEALWR